MLDKVRSIEPEILPSGFIFHISRCGSTLVSNALRAIPGTIVISEPQPISSIVEVLNDENGCERPCSTENMHEDILRGLVNAYGQRRVGNENGLVIKFTSWNILRMQTIRRLWPNVPVLVVVRHPIEVAVSCLKSPTGWMNWRDNAEVCSKLLGWTREECALLNAEAFCARVIGEFCRKAGAEEDPLRRIIDYDEITLNNIIDIAKFFSLEVPLASVEQIKDSLMMYSKSAAPTITFVSDRDTKRKQASESLRAEVGKWAQLPYDKVRKGSVLRSDQSECVALP